MNNLFVVALFALVAVAYAAEKYTNKFDNVDLDNIIRNDRLLKNYVDCLLDKGKCTPEGTELKRLIPDALKTHCGKCSEKQRLGSKKIIRHLIKNKREMWDQLEAKYDPEHVYRTEYADELKKDGIVL